MAQVPNELKTSGEEDPGFCNSDSVFAFLLLLSCKIRAGCLKQAQLHLCLLSLWMMDFLLFLNMLFHCLLEEKKSNVCECIGLYPFLILECTIYTNPPLGNSLCSEINRFWGPLEITRFGGGMDKRWADVLDAFKPHYLKCIQKHILSYHWHSSPCPIKIRALGACQ